MLCAGVIHGDLSEFNILLAADGPVIIDLPQAVDAAGNNHAPRMLMRDVDNLRAFFGRFAPRLIRRACRRVALVHQNSSQPYVAFTSGRQHEGS
jgi:serine/threonine-protein kinase RIO1